jgi:hypothetical protein
MRKKTHLDRREKTAAAYLILTSLFAIGLSARSSAAVINLVQNPGFENGSGSTASGWVNGDWTQRITSFPHSGSECFRITAAGRTEFPHSDSTAIPVTPGNTYEVSAWGRYDSIDPLDVTHTGDLKAVFYNSGGAQLTFTESYFLSTADPVNTWKLADFTLTAPPTSDHMVVQVGVAAGTLSNAAVYYDDVIVSQIPEPVGLALWLCSGLVLLRRKHV